MSRFRARLLIMPLIVLCQLHCTEEKSNDFVESAQTNSANVGSEATNNEEVLDVPVVSADDPFQELEETKKPKAPSLAKILEDECGLADPLNSQAVILEQAMVNPYQRVLISGLLDVYIDIFTTIYMKNTQARSDFTIDLNIRGVAANYKGEEAINLQPVMDQAMGEAAMFTGTTTNIAPDKENPIPDEWADLVCTVAFAGTSVTTIGGYETEIKFTPPLPTGVSPNPIAERFESEIGRFRHFPNITAEILRTNNPRLSVGQKITGSVFIERLPATRVTPRMDLKGNVAYRVTNSFKDRRTTADLGMLLWSEVYIDHETQEYQNFASDLGTDLQYLYKEGAEPFPSSMETQP
ncbi:hypothetical protein [Pseudobacteriovorax antillogorgiicola]|uniref:Uncharacterized protein n=1 Tax=Pseudobacteriovorax antillogorgiicola TaxID=1513793 RepID=A0A1Y6BND3_9BACT|nr:hypothetical protein [Pseudobacteriovorax antillogorgiicola]TCS54530.1 hypothetical protein EDD56_10643 [Pseudobacteriovorax antillogorgiicola]SMF18738.1 hypothetical protein SAMN06296036_106200 [Pseudobacteriovorax antillogorgiicola]